MDTRILELIIKYGLPSLVMALIVISLVGIVKIFTKGILTKKEVSESKKKWFAKLYMLLSLVFSCIVVIIYKWLIAKTNVWTSTTFAQVGSVYLFTEPLYNFYKQLGGRKFLLWVVKLFQGKDKNFDEFIGVLETILNDEAPFLTDTQKQAIETKVVALINGEKTEEKVEEGIEKVEEGIEKAEEETEKVGE